MTLQKGDFTVSDDKGLLNVGYIHEYLSKKSYWSQNIPVGTVVKAIKGSICFGLYSKQQQIGFARVVTDRATFAYLADVFIDENYRGKGLSRWLMESLVSHADLKGLRRWMLATRDAHGLYEKFGFTAIENPAGFMQRHDPDVYTRPDDDNA